MSADSEKTIPIATMSFPTRMIVGPGALARLPEEIRSLGSRNVLVVTDPGVKTVGLLDRVGTTLDRANLGYTTYLGVSKNPKEEDVVEGVKTFRKCRAELVIGLGGGAALDVAKAIRLKATHHLPLESYDDGKDGSTLISAEQPPMIAIPTTAGTGSEVGRSTVIRLGSEGRKVIIFSPFLMPNVALCDAELTIGLPPNVTAATGMDALTHALESYVSTGVHPFADAFALGALVRIGNHLTTAVRNGRNLRARHEMMLAASMGAVSFQKGLGVCHALAHPLSAVADMHHGLANSIMLPHVIAYNLEFAIGAYAVAGEALGAKPNGTTQEAKARACLDEVKKIVADVGLPTRLSHAGVRSDDIERMVVQAVEDASASTNPRPFDVAAARRLYLSAM